MLTQGLSYRPQTRKAARKTTAENKKGGMSPDQVTLSNGSSRSAELEMRNAALKFKTMKPVQSRGDEFVSVFPGRTGYDTDFLGVDYPLPKVAPHNRDKVAELIGKPGESELKYTNFSIVMNKERRQAFFTAVNLNGAEIVSVPREGGWAIDGRIERDHQLGNEAYGRNPIDRGHLVRRRDPVWGDDPERASADTFVYTNAGLQHGDLNQRTWLDLENHVLEQAKQKDMKLTVLTGPVFNDDDPPFDNRGRVSPPTQIPQEFWKLVVWNDPDEGLKGAAFIQSQKDYVGDRSNSLFKADFDAGSLDVYQVPIKELAKTTELDFGELADTTDRARRLDSAPENLLS